MGPIIGVTPLWDEERDSIWMLPGYVEGIRQAGGVPLILPFTGDEEEIAGLADLCGGILFTGGQDVDPRIYGQEPLEGLNDCCGKRDALETVLLRAALEKDKAILGICRGIQLINAALGGTLYQDIPLQYPSELRHNQEAPYSLPVHRVEFPEDTPLRKLLGVGGMPVNSLHHQAVRKVAPGLEVMARASDGLVEGLYMPEKRFLWALQWHPEYSWQTDPNSLRIFEAFTAAAG